MEESAKEYIQLNIKLPSINKCFKFSLVIHHFLQQIQRPNLEQRSNQILQRFDILNSRQFISFQIRITYYFIYPNQYVTRMTNNYDFMFKFIIIGDSSVGKSCLLLRFTEGRFKSDHEPTLGVEFGSRNMNICDSAIKIQIWDTAGQESFKSITRSYYKSSIAAFLVFDVTKRDSFQNLNKWLYEVRNNAHDKIQITVIGNKIDLKENREISQQEAEKFATTLGFAYYETSAQSGQKVQEVFKSIAEKIVKMIQKGQINPQQQSSYGIKRGRKNKKQSPVKNIKFDLKEEQKKKKEEVQKRKCC